MSRYTNRTLLSLASGLGLVLATAGVAPAAQRCTGFTAISTSSADVLCGCTTVTTGFIRAVQAKNSFPSILAATSTQCPGLANVLSDQPTAAPGSPFPGPQGDDEPTPASYEEPEDDEPAQEEEPGGEQEGSNGDECGYGEKEYSRDS